MNLILKENFKHFINRFSEALSCGSLNNASEETVRTWINEMLNLFGWDVQNTNQILQERTLDKAQRERLRSIGSTNTRPDYTFVNGGVQLAFLDAKNLDVSIATDSAVSFQIRSYGWSIGAAYSVVTNMKELAVYDCRQMPKSTEPATFARVLYLKHDEFVSNYDTLCQYLEREKVISTREYYFTDNGDSVDKEFTKLLSNFRVELIEVIIKSNPSIDVEEAPLTLWAQIIIDRILFIRVCESRGLEREGLLKDFENEGFWNKFKSSSYLEFYDRYDGPLFERNQTLHELTIGNDVFSNLLNVLYYPSPYRFDVIPLKTIGDIYDRFLGYAVNIDDNGKVSLRLKEEYRKSNGAVTTPQNLVTKTIESVLDTAALVTKPVDELLKLRFVDPACGSGVFLATLFDILSSLLLAKVEKGDDVPPSYYIKYGNKTFLTIEGRKSIVQQCIYGVDIDQEAVEVANMSLSLKTIDGYLPSVFEKAGLLGYQILHGIGENIKCGNSLVSSDILDSHESLYDNPAEIKMMRILNWRETFPAIFDDGGFDFVIGNPPYVEVKNYNSNLPSMATWIKETYPCSKKGKIDLSIPFIERGIEILKEGGKLSYIVQKRFFKTDYGKALRTYIRNNNLLFSIFEYEDNDMFAGKITYVAILSLLKGTNRRDSFMYASSTQPENRNISTGLMDDSGWSFDNIPLLELRNKLSYSIGVLDQSFKIQVGIQVLWVKAYHIKADSIKNGIIKGKSSLDSNVTVEEGACREIICNEQFSPYTLPPKRTFAIFPYDVTESEVRAIPFSEYKKRFPKAARYLLLHKEEIVSNVQIQPERNHNLNRDEYWHIFTRTQNLDTVNPKVVIPMTTFYPIASIVEQPGIYCDNVNVNFIQFPETDGKAHVLAGIVNSRVFGVLARNMANPSSGDYAKYNKEFLRNVPFPNYLFEEDSEQLKDIAATSKRLEKLYCMYNSASSSEKRSLRHAIDKLLDLLDQQVALSYKLTEGEKHLIFSQPYYER